MLHERKSPRIPKYDYSTPNYYFITICTNHNQCLFWTEHELNAYGKIAYNCMVKIPEIYAHIQVDKFVIMPNHVHAIMIVQPENSGENKANISRVIGQYKMAVTKSIHKTGVNIPIWQRSFYDHIIRNEQGYLKIWEYIDNNPLKWELDCFYPTKK